MAKRNGTIHEIIETNRRRPWRHAPSAHWTALILTGILSAPTIADTIRDRDPCMLMASLGLAIVFLWSSETALYLISLPLGRSHKATAKDTHQPNR